MITINNEIERIFSTDNLDADCGRIASLMNPYVDNMKELVYAGAYSQAIILFLQLVDATCRHFVSEEHWCYFDDCYSPSFTLDWAYGILSIAVHDKKMSKEQVCMLRQGLDELRQSDAYQQYAYPSINKWII